MTEPTKLPRVPSGVAMTLGDALRDYGRVCVEQATADLRAMLDRAIERLHAAEAALQPVKAERDEARAEIARLTELLSDVRAVESELAEKSDELARLTTLRPMSEYDGSWAIYWRTDGPRGIVPSYTSTAKYWTPLPNVKEAKP